MSIWAIADIHASRTDSISGRPVKPMDIFGEAWSNHIDRLTVAWKESVQPDDTVIVAGDIDWALHLSDAMETLELLDSLPGDKLLIRGNHDYWWSSKVTNRVRKILPPSMQLIHNESYVREGINICGTKGSPVPGGADWTADDEKLLNREVGRLEASLRSRVAYLPTIVAVHYPPFYPAHPDTPYTRLLSENHVDVCVFGHLHGAGAAGAASGCKDGTMFKLVAGDSLNFRPILLARSGRFTSGVACDSTRTS